MPSSHLAVQLEALLFVANEPLPLERLAALTDSQPDEVKQVLTELTEARRHSGIQITHLHDTYRLTTAPQADATVRRYLESETRAELSKPALETLAIIAYRGPITKAQIEEIRGVASDTMLRNLLQRGLIIEQGAAPEPGKPALYAVSHTFLQHFGLTSLADLPPLNELSDEAA